MPAFYMILCSFRTDSALTNIAISNNKATVKHFGNANAVNVISVDGNNSFYEYGSVAAINVKEVLHYNRIN